MGYGSTIAVSNVSQSEVASPLAHGVRVLCEGLV